VCKREISRCEKCARGHETKDVNKLCVLTNGAGHQKCLVREKQVDVAIIRVLQKVSYAEAVKEVVKGDGCRVRDPMRLPVCWLRPVESDRNNMFFSKIGFFAFIAMVINCTAEMET
jgi:hypothetical protein